MNSSASTGVRFRLLLIVAILAVLLLVVMAFNTREGNMRTATQEPSALVIAPLLATDFPKPTMTVTPLPTVDVTASAVVEQATASALETATAQQVATQVALQATATAVAPLAPTLQVGQGEARASYNPAVDRLLLDNGYYANIIPVGSYRGLRASQRNYSNSVWTRDLDYAISGYSYALGDMALFADNIALFMGYVSAEGVAPETIYLRGQRLDWENRQSWDSMPNLLHAAYVYIAKTGDREFYLRHRTNLLRIGEWIARLSSSGDGFPDRDIFPFGYYDSVRNGPLHTYAMARFYGAYLELAELEAMIGLNDAIWRERAAALRAGFNRPLAEGGYWLEDQPWPIAWKHDDGRVVPILETFGVFAALQSGLIAPEDEHYPALVEVLHSNLPTFIDGPTPFRLTLGGYEPEVRRVVDPPVPVWMLDASAPWIVGRAAPTYSMLGFPGDAQAIMDAYVRMVENTNPPVVEFSAGPNTRYGPGDSNDRGRTWDSAGWFMAIYGGHYGLTMTPAALIVAPRPYQAIPDDHLTGFSYQGARINLRLDQPNASYSIQTDSPIEVLLRPMGTAQTMRVDDGPLQAEQRLLLEPEREYTIWSE
ncbi:hypothetical protein [Candidatus Viridilinea mediisalina]|uniref:Glycogen debranching protein n=1 Tax=Candidatus Viridilinea mediisalina TaxID=2024553 RepID=A0A2A6RN13_9CHLR|nr:hypothetical protein [Candidatus Viridilinea mediisalina]PDW04427.1 hypothetical protein CJ255_03310 [Candidatus Viridilinea mediisalina]